MKQYEYRVEYVGPEHVFRGSAEELNVIGANGWLLVTVWAQGDRAAYYFVRKIG